VTTILTDPDLRADWEAELEETRNGMLALRQQLADELKRLTNSDRFDFLAKSNRGGPSGAAPFHLSKTTLAEGIQIFLKI